MPDAPVPPGGRRLEVLEAARRLLALSSYRDVGIREIAAEAGVSAGLVMKYYGSKEALALRAVDFEDRFTELLAGPLDELGYALVRRLAEVPRAPEGTDPLGLLLFIGRSKGLPGAMRSALLDQFVARLRDRLTGRQQQLRAELVCAQLVGITALRRTLEAPQLSRATPEQLVQLIGPGVQALVDGAIPTVAGLD
jgi:AcrR family transcriptional regulator